MKIMIIAGDSWSLVNYRTPLIRALVARGWEVVTCAPPGSPAVERQLSELGARFVPVPLERASMNPVADFRFMFRLKSVIARESPHTVLTLNIKPVLYGSLAAAWAGVPGVFAMITGLGSAFADNANPMVRLFVTLLYRAALRRCRRVFAQNPDIAAFLIRSGATRPGQIVNVRGSGADLRRFQFSPLPANRRVSFLLLARLLRDKGIYEYVEAARILRAELPEAEFKLAGPIDPNPTGISIATVEQWQREGAIEYLPFQEDVRPLLASCSTYLLPSYYPEGVPRSVLEAMAMGRPVITADSAGCRETIRRATVAAPRDGLVVGENGILVAPRSVHALTAAMRLLAGNPELAARMGRRGREIAEEEFDADKISEHMIATMEA